MKHIQRKTPKMLLIEEKFQIPIEELLLKLYVDDNMKSKLIAQEIGLSVRLVKKWLKLAGIYSRKLEI